MYQYKSASNLILLRKKCFVKQAISFFLPETRWHHLLRPNNRSFSPALFLSIESLNAASFIPDQRCHQQAEQNLANNIENLPNSATTTAQLWKHVDYQCRCFYIISCRSFVHPISRYSRTFRTMVHSDSSSHTKKIKKEPKFCSLSFFHFFISKIFVLNIFQENCCDT